MGAQIVILVGSEETQKNMTYEANFNVAGFFKRSCA